MSRDDEIGPRIDAILELGRRTRKPVPRALWLAAAVVAVICATGLAMVLLGGAPPARSQPQPRVDRDAPAGAGFGTGLALGAAAGLAIGVALARQRRDHSSRNRP